MPKAAYSLQFARLYASKFPPHTVINMPALLPTMTQGGIVAWNKLVGDELAPGESIAEIETDKASMDFEFQEEGYLAKIIVDAGAKDLPVGKPIAVYVEDKSDVAAFADFTAEDAGGSAAPAKAEAPKEEAPAKEEAPKAAAAAPKAAAASSSAAPTDRIFASPRAKTIALDKGILLKEIKGTGPGGRIVAKDVESYTPKAAAPAAAPAAATYTDIPITTMRKVIGQRLLQLTQQLPTYIVLLTVLVSKLLKLRQLLNATADGRYKLSVNDLVLKAVALAAKRVPAANSAWIESEGVIREYANVDVLVAVATPTGLITPIVKDAHAKGLSAISAEMKDLGKRAKDNKLAPEEFQGGTITISNLGMNPAVTMFTSIINPPQLAIIAVLTVVRQAIEDPAAESGVLFDLVMTLTGTFDHRTVDGAVGGDFMKALKTIVENPLELLL